MPNKFKAIKCSYDGIKFDSKKERDRYIVLKADKSVKNLQVHKPYTLIDKSIWGREIKYLADFVYTKDNEEIVEDVKSKITITPLFRLKKRLFEERYNKTITIREKV